LLVGGSAIAWSLGGLFTRVLTVDTATMIFWRGLFGALGLAMVIPFTSQHAVRARLRQMGLAGWLFVLLGATGMICYMSALRHTSVANVAIIYATAPFMAAALAWMALREAPPRSALIASGVALLGVALMVGFSGPAGWFGDALALCMTATMAVAAVVARRATQIPILLTSCIASLLSALLCWPFASPLHVTLWDLLILALFGVLNFALGLPLYTFGARLLPAIETALIGALESPLAPLWVWLAIGEQLSTNTLLGGAIVMAAVVGHFLWNHAAKTRGR